MKRAERAGNAPKNAAHCAGDFKPGAAATLLSRGGHVAG